MVEPAAEERRGRPRGGGAVPESRVGAKRTHDETPKVGKHLRRDVPWLRSLVMQLRARMESVVMVARGDFVHSRYNGWPRLAKFFSRSSERTIKGGLEPAVVILTGILLLPLSQPLGSYLMAAGIALALSHSIIVNRQAGSKSVRGSRSLFRRTRSGSTPRNSTGCSTTRSIVPLATSLIVSSSNAWRASTASRSSRSRSPPTTTQRAA